MRSDFNSHTFFSASLCSIAVNEALLLRWSRHGQMLAGFPIRIECRGAVKYRTSRWKGMDSILERGHSGSARRACTLTTDGLESPNVLHYSAGLGSRPLWALVHSDPLRTPFWKSCYQLFSDHRRSKNKIKCWCTWREANRLRANRRDQMFVSKHTTLWLGLFLLLCPDSFFILFKQLDGKENWLKPNWCFMVSSSSEKMAV